MFDEHTFSVCAYGKSLYLEQCIKSLLRQNLKSNVIICTSTPNEHIKHLSEKYNIKLYVREGKSDIKDDWNFAYNMAKTRYVTIAHQDDVYNKRYTEELNKMIKKDKNFLIYYCGYRPIKNKKISTDVNCIIRAMLRSPMNIGFLRNISFFKLATLAFGNSICCPSVTYDKKTLGDDIFSSALKFNIDWDTFYKLAYMKGKFIYNNRILMYYRIHDDATSKEFIDNNGRIDEDIYMFDKFWPHFITKFIMKFYTKAYITYSN
ncbi:MAG: glycosyltransferase family 2 protein [Lachnospiraceae bacterium]|nr:glycosyltransferase family 2 protein [Lachnospiraceae bacterium]